MSRYDLLSLQGKAKRDPEGYRDDVLMQLQHYNALHGLFMLKPGKDFKAFADLTNFLAQVAKSYPRDMPDFHRPIIELLDAHYALLEPSLRRSLVSALILLHNRGACALGDLLPLFFKMLRCADKPLRALVFAHVVAAVRRVRGLVVVGRRVAARGPAPRRRPARGRAVPEHHHRPPGAVGRVDRPCAAER